MAAYLLLVTTLRLLHRMALATKVAVVQLFYGIERRRVVLLVHADHHEHAQVGGVHIGVGNAPRAGEHLLHVGLVRQVARGLLEYQEVEREATFLILAFILVI